MANTKSAAKRARISAKRRAVNKKLVSNARTAQKKIISLVAAGKKDEAAKLLSEAQSAADLAAKRGIYHKNKAARVKARLAKNLK